MKYKRKPRLGGIDNFFLSLMSLPGILLIIVFSYLPMYGLIIAFKNYSFDKGILGSPWSGWDNFDFFFSSQDVRNVLRNTILLNFGSILLSTVASIVLALLLYEVTRPLWIKIYQTTLFFPFFLSWVVVSFASYAFLSENLGIINKLLENLGFETVGWYSDPKYWPYILILASVWKSVGYGTILYYSSLLSIDKEYFEAAEIDGASKLRTTWSISLPFLAPIITILTILSVGRIFYSDFGLYYFLPMQSGMLMPATDVIDTYAFRTLRVVGDIGMSSAVNFFQSVMGLAVILFANLWARKIDKDSALF
ncbi:ABC transporter permease [Cohnella herbarum]|uniref:Sugar ABC transporter permease n=1 Tax=Cohnella herbarum TaxID=2728023 RepID=A0A7Z2ZQX4_9BACL|nr:ABC transporter permease subunit [Cohnella herbarum]QJD87487.1 sugar ABC transporter permease [Cohnella herbarum]